MEKQYVIKADDQGVFVTKVDGLTAENGTFVSWKGTRASVYPPGMYASVPGRLMTVAREIANDCDMPYIGLIENA